MSHFYQLFYYAILLFYFNVILDDDGDNYLFANIFCCFLSILMMENLGNTFERLNKSVNTF